MKTLTEIKNEAAVIHGHKNYHYWGLSENGYRERASASDEIAKAYATEAIKADRERVAKNVRLVESVRHSAIYDAIDKESILSLPIELP